MFDNVDFENQLKYISDCGSGDGTLLKQFYNLIRKKSLRGRHLDTHPLTLIAIDFNDKALDEARNTLKEYDCIFIKGDIGRHEEILANLKNMGVKSREEVLHIRSFLDHNRFYTPPRHKARKDDRAYSGVYGDGNGKDITPEKVVQNLVEHLKKWASIIGRHGLIILEVHCLELGVVHSYIDSNECFHFDAFHSF